jgi:hypothetical protein
MNRTIAIRQIKQALCVLGIGLCVGGIFVSIPDTYKTWKFSRVTRSNLFGTSYTEDKIYRFEEPISSGESPYKIVYGQSQRKMSGFILIFFGGNLAWFFGQDLADEFSIIEKRRWKVQQTEFLIEDTTLKTGTEVHTTMLEMDLLSRLAEFQQGFKPENVHYLPDDEEPADDDTSEDNYPETANGFFLWLTDKNIRQAKVRDISQKSFNNKHLSAEQVRAFVDDLISQKLADWLDEAKNEFRLLNNPG